MTILKTLWIAAMVWSFASMAEADRRIALVIGNGDYLQVGPLDNPSNDAAEIADALAALDFTVTLIRDANLPIFRAAVAQFGRDLRAAGPEVTGLFFYAGHAVQSFGTNYLLPTDTVVTDAADLDLVAVEAGAILRQMSSAKNRTNIVILDSCRNNPYQDLPDFDSNGLAEMQAPTGTFLSYATEPGNVSYDGLGANSTFTAALLAQISSPGEPIEQLFKKVRVRVLDESGGLQTPWDTSSLTTDFSFAPATVTSPEEAAQAQLWGAVQASGDPVQLMLFLRAYPDSVRAVDARALLSATMVAEAEAETLTDKLLPDADEIMSFEAAVFVGSIESLEAYLMKYPDNYYTKAVLQKLLTIKQETTPETSNRLATMGLQEGVTFDGLVEDGAKELVGFSIAELIRGSPLYPPLENLPETYWKTKSCSNCHQWTRDALCTQSHVYKGQADDRSLAKRHPYGGALKQVLRSWAAGGCK